MTRLIRIFKVITKSQGFAKFIRIFKVNQGAMRLVTFFVTMVAAVHVVGCLWILVASMNNFNPDTWVAKLELVDEDNYTIYLTAIYWAF
jgi:hypothetical protein